MQERYDVVVIGAGCVGANVAYRLAERGALDYFEVGIVNSAPLKRGCNL